MTLSRAPRFAVKFALGALTVLVCLLVAASALAEPVRVVVIRPEPGGPILDEALIRIRGELTAVGLGVEIRSPDLEAPDRLPEFGPLDYGVVELIRYDTRIEIRAHAPGLDSPVVQSADTAHADINAEVVAIRTVEALRAAMVQYARRKQARRETLPKPVTGFTRLEEEEEPRVVTRPPPKERPPIDTPAPRPSSELDYNLWLGGMVAFDPATSLTSVGGQGAFFIGRSWYRVGVAADRTTMPQEIDEAEGSVWVTRTSVTGRLKAELEPVQQLAVFTALGGGAAEYRLESVAEPGFVSTDRKHWSALVSADAGVAYWFLTNVGAYLSFRVDLATDAPEVLIAARDVAVLGQPSMSGSLGLTLGRW